MMKYIFYSLFLSALSAHAQSFRLFGVKSGMVEYEITQFVTHTVYSVDTAGKEKNSIRFGGIFDDEAENHDKT